MGTRASMMHASIVRITYICCKDTWFSNAKIDDGGKNIEIFVQIYIKLQLPFQFVKICILRIERLSALPDPLLGILTMHDAAAGPGNWPVSARPVLDKVQQWGISKEVVSAVNLLITLLL